MTVFRIFTLLGHGSSNLGMCRVQSLSRTKVGCYLYTFRSSGVGNFPRDVFDTIPPMIGGREGHRNESMLRLGRIHPVAREGTFHTKVLHKEITAITRPRVIITKRPEHNMISTLVPLPVF
jgi:hypothetical protein